MQRVMLAGEDSRGYLVINCILAFNFEDERIIDGRTVHIKRVEASLPSQNSFPPN
jgi:hypothetical protein